MKRTNIMERDNKILLATLLAATGLLVLKKKRSRRRSHRRGKDQRHSLQEIKSDPKLFFRYTRMTVPIFNTLSEILRPSLTEESHGILVPEERLAMTLRYLATGDRVSLIALAYRVEESTASSIIEETCSAIIDILAADFLRPPERQDWINICKGFWRDWRFPNCVGAVDGRHIQIQGPSSLDNGKKTYSKVLMAACDNKYKFTLVDIGAYGSDNDAEVFSRSELGKALRDKRLELPQGIARLPGSVITTPCFFVGNDAFQLTENMMKPFADDHLTKIERHFNHRISKARRTIKNAFGILAARWKVFEKPICMSPASVDKIVMACVGLHNYLMTLDDELPPQDRLYCPPNFADSESENGDLMPGEWRNEHIAGLKALAPSRAYRDTPKACIQRYSLAHFFSISGDGIP